MRALGSIGAVVLTALLASCGTDVDPESLHGRWTSERQGGAIIVALTFREDSWQERHSRPGLEGLAEGTWSVGGDELRRLVNTSSIPGLTAGETVIHTVEQVSAGSLTLDGADGEVQYARSQ